MRKVILFSLFIPIAIGMSFSPTYGQSWDWGREPIPFGGGGGGEIRSDHSIAVDDEGNVYAIGDFGGQLRFGNDFVNGSNGRLFLVKYDVNGNTLWIKQVNSGVTGTGYLSSVGVDGSANVYVAGYFTDTLSFGAIKLMSATGTNTFIAKYDMNGNVLWVKQSTSIRSSSTANAGSLAVDNSGNVYIAGYFADTVCFGTDTLKATSNNGETYLAKYTAGGTIAWVEHIVSTGYSNYNQPASVALDNAGNPLITGIFRSTVILGRDTFFTVNAGNMYTAKYTSAGNVVWGKVATLKPYISEIMPESISVDYSGNAYVTGYFVDTIAFDTQVLSSPRQNKYTVFLVKYDGRSSKVSWAIQENNTDTSNWVPYSISSDTLPAGGCYLTMATDGFSTSLKLIFDSDTLQLKSQYSTATVIMHVDSSGALLCGTIFTEGNEDDGDAIGVNHSGGFAYLGGDLADTTVFGYDTLPYGNDMPFIARWHQCGANDDGIQEIPNNKNSFTVYPNPFTNITTIAVNTYGKHYLEVYDLTGRKLQSIEFAGKQYQLSSQGLAKGMYFVSVFDSANVLIGTSKIVVE